VESECNGGSSVCAKTVETKTNAAIDNHCMVAIAG
jgi:hypothetical protein